MHDVYASFDGLICLETRTWITSAEHVRDIGSQNRVKRLVKFEIDARAIADEIATITWSIHSFTVRTSYRAGVLAADRLCSG
jgi:hypothetical protein